LNLVFQLVFIIMFKIIFVVWIARGMWDKFVKNRHGES
jgi:hypothetical protein